MNLWCDQYSFETKKINYILKQKKRNHSETKSNQNNFNFPGKFSEYLSDK